MNHGLSGNSPHSSFDRIGHHISVGDIGFNLQMLQTENLVNLSATIDQ